MTRTMNEVRKVYCKYHSIIYQVLLRYYGFAVHIIADKKFWERSFCFYIGGSSKVVIIVLHYHSIHIFVV